ncbi:MAG: hypothetical protein KGN77_08020 [Xanthomonadaceae bacterium]|nr:hypothetical protein [Xanthomonadaceae bacterium]MDE1963367.1 hypothetical protein [Xanthomonadaceae bacterium]
MRIRVLRDRLTLAVAGHPQVYLYGVIDAGAPQRFARLVEAGRIASGSDVYLSSRQGDVAAGMALGRMIRRAGMATHLGAPRKTWPGAGHSRAALCVDACAFAFFGGLYRWAPSGSDRLGFSPAARGAASSRAYLKAMGIDPDVLADAANASPGAVQWLVAERLEASGAVNNGRLPPTASYDLASPTPSLDLRQVDRKGEHRLTVTCHPGRTEVAAYEKVGALRARQIVARGARSYLQLDGRTVLPSHRGVSADGDTLVIRRDYPPSDLVHLLFAGSIGAWVDGRSAAFRDGFTIHPWGAYAKLKVFYHACWQAAPWVPQVAGRG